MKLVATLTIAILCQELAVLATRGRSDDLSRALGELRRRRRRLENGYSVDTELPRHQFGTVTHYSPEKRQFRWAPELMKSALPPPGDEEEDRKKKMAEKRSVFREREHKLDEMERKRKRMPSSPRRESDSDFDDTWESSEAELMKDLAQRRFLDALLGKSQQQRATETNQIPAEFDQSAELENLNLNLDKEDISALMELLRKQLYNSPDEKYYMEGEGGDENDDENDEDESDEERKKRFLLKKRIMWQDGVRYSLGDRPNKRMGIGYGDYDPEVEAWWRNLDPRILAEIEEMDEDSGEMKRKREPDAWYPAYELPERKYEGGMTWLDDWRNKRKRGSAFRERINHGISLKKKVVKRIPEEMMAERKRIVKKSIPKVGNEGEKMMDELKTIMADEKSGEAHHRRERGSSAEADEEEFPSLEEPEMVESRSDDDDESPLSDYFGYDRRRDVKRKRSWDDFVGIDKRRDSHPSHHLDKEKEPEIEAKTVNDDKNNTTTEIAVAVPTMSPVKIEATTTILETTSVGSEENEENDEKSEEKSSEEHKLNNEKMQRYFKSIAAAMTVKKKRTPQRLDDDESDEPLPAMDRKLQAIENLMLDEILQLVEKNDGDELKNKIINRLDAAHSLEKMREALAEFDNSLDRIHEDQEMARDGDDVDEDDEDKRKKKKKVKKQSLSEALRVMAPQTQNRKRNDENMESECKIFSDIVLLCQELSKSAGDNRGALVDACSRHIMCYACDYAYKDGPQTPCDLIFMREGHDICGDDIYCRSASAQMHGILRQRAKVTERASVPVCLSESCVRAYRRR